MPMLEIDGQKLVQTKAISNYVAQKYGYAPADPMAAYKGEKAIEYWMEDVVMKHIFKGTIFVPEADKPAALEKLLSEHFPAAMKLLSEKCLGDTKFISGDELSIADFCVGGFFTNLVFMDKTRVVGIKACYDTHAPEKLKTYVTAFQTEMKDYLDKRATEHGEVTM